MADYIKLGDLDLYRMAVELSREAWPTYEGLNWQDKKIMGDQFIESIDSVGANIAEGYGRYHYKDRIKFYYNARGSLSESKHWGLFSYERGKINKAKFYSLLNKQQALHKKLNSYISSCYNYKQ
ncbi:four helix bundle protein [Candidatus Falkowbacteria bacterium RIFCSPLOWO2_02_FULL_45_15]|uniref:Four helix bundle protein n=1 Tax=Candidatus Falkowbacteria bacterium RIFCSPLOWO2_02_FULL_45_15 TaxID=1797988 RepID=A0A1F5S125_9BACT|nr:MAG: four helix bundle protein [Candidatus Falkowbacteria bacterium RIFCSPLOWO2_02_FULL_45_15]